MMDSKSSDNLPIADSQRTNFDEQDNDIEREESTGHQPVIFDNSNRSTHERNNTPSFEHVIIERPSLASLRPSGVSTPLMLPQTGLQSLRSSPGALTLAHGFGEDGWNFGIPSGSLGNDDKLERIFTGTTTACDTVIDEYHGTTTTAGAHTLHNLGKSPKYPYIPGNDKAKPFGDIPEDEVFPPGPNTEVKKHATRNKSSLLGYLNYKRKRKGRRGSVYHSNGDEEPGIYLERYQDGHSVIPAPGNSGETSSSSSNSFFLKSKKILEPKSQRRVQRSESDDDDDFYKGNDISFIKRFYRWLIIGGGIHKSTPLVDSEGRHRNYEKYPNDSIFFLFGGRILSARDTPLNVFILGLILVLGGLFFGFM